MYTCMYINTILYCDDLSIIWKNTGSSNQKQAGLLNKNRKRIQL